MDKSECGLAHSSPDASGDLRFMHKFRTNDFLVYRMMLHKIILIKSDCCTHRMQQLFIFVYQNYTYPIREEIRMTIRKIGQI